MFRGWFHGGIFPVWAQFRPTRFYCCSFASVSALSFPAISWCPDTHFIVISRFGFCFLVSSKMFSTPLIICWPDCCLGLATALIAAWLSTTYAFCNWIGSDEYEDILYNTLFSLIDDLLNPPEEPGTIHVAEENTFIFMQDNATCHKAKPVLEFLKENHVPVMDWPPQSSDLNPIENLWPDLKARFHQWFVELFNYLSKSLEARYHYSEILQDVWYSQGMELITALIESMPKRCAGVIKARGGWIKY